jgi:hypothetical protein
MPKLGMQEIRERAERIRMSAAVRKMSGKPAAPLFVPTRLVEERQRAASGKAARPAKNEIDIDKLAAQAQKKAAEEQKKASAPRNDQAEADKKKMLDYSFKKVKDLKKDGLVRIVTEGNVKVDKQKPKAVLIEAIMTECEKKGCEWLLKMI